MIPCKALVLGARTLLDFARTAQLVERRLQVFHHAGREDGHVAEGPQRVLVVADRGEKRRCALEPAEARPLDIAGPSFPAQSDQFVAKLLDIVVEFYPSIAADLLF